MTYLHAPVRSATPTSGSPDHPGSAATQKTGEKPTAGKWLNKLRIFRPNLFARGSGEKRRKPFRDPFPASGQSPRSGRVWQNPVKLGDFLGSRSLGVRFANANWRRESDPERTLSAQGSVGAGYASEGLSMSFSRRPRALRCGTSRANLSVDRTPAGPRYNCGRRHRTSLPSQLATLAISTSVGRERMP
jgi:hypothetical protein